MELKLFLVYISKKFPTELKYLGTFESICVTLTFILKYFLGLKIIFIVCYSHQHKSYENIYFIHLNNFKNSFLVNTFSQVVDVKSKIIKSEILLIIKHTQLNDLKHYKIIFFHFNV